jgi:hypothetical protein
MLTHKSNLMKKSLIVSVFILIAGIAFGQTLKKGCIIAFRPFTVTLQPNVTIEQYQDFMLREYFPELEKAFPGSKAFLLKGNRGTHKDGLAWIWYFDSEQTRGTYWDEDGHSTGAANAAAEKLAPFLEKNNNLVTAMESEFTDWIILPQSTASELDLKKGTVLGLHYIDLKLEQDVTLNQYLDFLAVKYIPELEKIAQGWTIYMLKGDRGQHENEYAWMYWIESLEARDQYEPEAGVLSEEGKAVVEKITPLFDELQKLGTWTGEYTDWVIL